MSDLHTDFVALRWHSMQLELIRREPPDAEPFDGSYAYRSEAHTDEECPFRDAFVIDGRQP